MTLRRVVLIGILLAATAVAVIQVRLLTASTARAVLLLARDKQRLRHRIYQQELHLARLRAPWRIAARLDAMDLNVLPPGLTPDKQQAGATSGRPERTSTDGIRARRTERRQVE